MGEPIYYRFDSFIKFEELSIENKKIIIERKYNNHISNLEGEDKTTIESKNVKEFLINSANNIPNARKIDSIIKDTLSLIMLDKILSDD